MREPNAFGIDGNGQLIRSVVSNPGHCLWSGIASPERAREVVRRLLADDMWSGWGIRTLSASHPAYSAHSYQRGSVWPHDNSIIAAGFARYGFRHEANRVIQAMFDAAICFEDHRLPELFAGFPRTYPGFPVPYLRSNAPQAWAAGCVFLMIQTLLGLRVEAGERLVADAKLPRRIERLVLHNVRVGSRPWTIRADGGKTEVVADEAS